MIRKWMAIVGFVALAGGCSEVEPKPDTLSCGGDTTPDMCGCPGDRYPSTECVDGQWFCPGPNGCPDPPVNNPNSPPNSPPNNPPNNNVTCVVDSESDLPGVSLLIKTDVCNFTRDELEAGVVFEYDYIIEEEIEIEPDAALSCWRRLPGNFPHDYAIAGDGQRYCLCDVGLCPEDTSALLLETGTYGQTFEWTGRNWDGPSDTGEPLGDPFPPGIYTLTVQSSGTYDGAPFEVVSRLDIAVVE